MTAIATVTTAGQSDGIVQKSIGLAASNAAVADTPVTFGFVPSYVAVFGIVNMVSYEWFKGMAQGDYIKTLANGTRSLETDDKLIVGAETDGPSATAPRGTMLVKKVAGEVLDDNDGFRWIAE